MALDGVVISNLVHELNSTIANCRISKIAQPESDELLLTCKGNGNTYKLAISASASLPFVYLTNVNKTSPLTAPTFCMVLRKHIANGRITKIYQPHLERIINIEIEHLDEMGDLCHKVLIIELMGKHSNIIFCHQDGTIIDSIKRVPASVSSIREVLPGRTYFIPETQNDKVNPTVATVDTIKEIISSKPLNITKAIYTSFVGISPLVASEIAYRADVDGDMPVASLTEEQLLHLANNFKWMMDDIKENKYRPCIVRNGNEPIEFCSFSLSQYQDYSVSDYDSISQVLEVYYAEKNIYTRRRQKSVDLRRIVNTALERNQKKYVLQQKQLKDSEKREKYKVYGELINTYGYSLEEGAKILEAPNYYDNNNIVKIPLDPNKTALENAQKYFDKYGKLKRTAEA